MFGKSNETALYIYIYYHVNVTLNFFLDCSISANERAKIIQSYNNYIYFTIF